VAESCAAFEEETRFEHKRQNLGYNPYRDTVMSFRVTTSRVEPDIVVLHMFVVMAIGPETDALESLFHDLLNGATTKVIFNLAGVVEIEANAALFLVRCFFAARGAGGQLRFAAHKTSVGLPFKKTMLDTLPPFDPSVTSACEHFVDGGEPLLP